MIWRVHHCRMVFEYDPDKSAANKDKHSIDFDEAQGLWLGDDVLEIDARSVGEPRYAAIGLIGSKFWTAIYARRGENIRLISVRRSREHEIEDYHDRRIR